MRLAFPLLFAFFLQLPFSVFGQSLTFQPANPIPGERVSIKYNPIGSALERAEKFEGVCYELSEAGIVATDVFFQQKEGAYVSAISISKEALAVFITLKSGYKKDNNNGVGYSLMVYQNDRKNQRPGAFAGMASAYGMDYWRIDIERNYELALTFLQKEYSLSPELKKEGKYLDNYSLFGMKAKDETVIAECKELIKTLRQSVTNEDDLRLIGTMYSYLGEEEAAKELIEKILSEYPDGVTAEHKLVDSFFEANSLDEKLKIYDAIKSKTSQSEILSKSFNRVNGTLAMKYAKLGDMDNFNRYFSLITDPLLKADYLNSLAWGMSGESLYARPEKAATGRELSKQSLDLIKAEMESGGLKPVEKSRNQWKRELESFYGMYADTYALCAYHDNAYQDALKHQTIACELAEFGDGEMAERYCVYLEKANGAEAVEMKLQKLISQGLATAKMKEQYRRIYMENNTLETAFEKNKAFLQSLADDKKAEELKKEIINEKAIDFTLLNLKGEKVALKDFKGKIVVLDFWATWCGPCIASFPGMQDAVEKYRENDEVVFLFLDTWESGENKKENAQKFIDEKGYDFNVLMDNENEVVAKYKVNGIPTKFVIDKNGNIRFRSSGFNGNSENLVNELSMMIEMTREKSIDIKLNP